MLRLLLAFTLFSLAALAALPAAAQRDFERRDQRLDERQDQAGDRGRFVIATARINSREEQVVFRVPKGSGRLSEISFRSGSDAILLNAAEITYADGRTQHVDIVDRLLPGEESQPIILDPGMPPVDEVVVWRRPSWRQSESTLQLIGVPRLERRDESARLDILDRKDVDSREERVVFRFEREGLRLDAIQFRTLNDRVLLGRADVDFGNGERESFDLVDRLMPGETSRLIEFGRPRRVQSIVLWKRPSWKPGRTTIELLGVEPRRAPAPPQWSGIGPDIPRGWVLFGTQDVQFKTDADTIPVGREVGRFDRIALRVLDNDVFIKEITVVYGNGEQDRRVIDTAIPAGRQTRPIELNGQRFIEEIRLVYRSRPTGNVRATVEVYGEFAKDWLGERGGWRQHNAGWAMLGAQRAAMLQKDTDSVIVGERFGRLKALRLTARRADVRLYSVKIFYGNGEMEELRLSATLRSGETSPPYEIRGRGRYIDRVVLSYRSKLDAKGSGIIEVWGLS